ncbi:MAG: polysaccharide deacetylase family protein [Oscillospiraceae bacterium]
MYWGSVRFYKHVILGAVFLMILLPSVCAVALGIKYHKRNIQVKNYQDMIAMQPIRQIINDINFTPLPSETVSFEYQELYPDLYVEKPEYVAVESDKPVVYLTFDDGPSSNTEVLLDLLKENGVKATFFVVYKEGDYAKNIYKRIVDEGHTLGVHSATHQYTEIYASVENYLQDFEKLATYLYEVTGAKPTIFRFPGGSINVYNKEIYMQLISEMLRRGYNYYDWNIASGDAASKGLTAAQIEHNIRSGIKVQRQSNIVLLHDSVSKGTTIEAMRRMLPTLKEECMLLPLSATVKPIAFSYLQ